MVRETTLAMMQREHPLPDFDDFVCSGHPRWKNRRIHALSIEAWKRQMEEALNRHARWYLEPDHARG